MILTCPNCGTQYVVKDGAIPPGGRQVRCASCKHSWHQDPEDEAVAPAPVAGDEPEPEVSPAPAALASEEAEGSGQPASAADHWTAVGDDDAPTAADAETEDRGDEDESFAEATMIEPRAGPEAEQRAYEEAVIASDSVEPDAVGEAEDHTEAPVDVDREAEADYAPRATELTAGLGSRSDADLSADDEFSPFADRDMVETRRRSPALTIAVLIVVIAAIAAAFWFLAPAEWKAGVGLNDGSKTPLELMITHPDRQKLASGQESLTITGRVINPTSATQAIPPIYAQLKNRAGQTIYSWTIDPPAPSLAPQASTPFNSTQVDVPPGGDDLTITLGAPKS